MNNFPRGWNEAKVKRVLAVYEAQGEDEAVAEDEAAMKPSRPTVMDVPKELVPAVRELIAKRNRS